MFEKILDILTNEMDLKFENVREDDTLVSIGIDSITFMTLIIYLEDKYNIEFSFDGIFMQNYYDITFSNLINEAKSLIGDKK